MESDRLHLNRNPLWQAGAIQIRFHQASRFERCQIHLVRQVSSLVSIKLHAMKIPLQEVERVPYKLFEIPQLAYFQDFLQSQTSKTILQQPRIANRPHLPILEIWKYQFLGRVCSGL